VHVALEEVDPLAAVPEDEVVCKRLVVAQEVLLDDFGLVTQTEDEVGHVEARVVAHDVPQDRLVADGNHRLRNPSRRLAHAQAEAAAEEHHLHGVPPSMTSSAAGKAAILFAE